ncbi:beta-glucuronidase [Contarinia nasturtii]|uniref:beta-glucuronidase n=1 Tax=Contarinia nasturtii TaxID=265458 RepID=UPI0012D3DAFF|nr:beta-glucuronidase [Contarinia nasturtii]XP_031622339.1 beta-glucuronidase [Contarinia nasturtii]
MRRSQCVLSFVFGFMMFSTKDIRTEGLLYPHESETREVKSLDGIWNFVKSNETAPTEGIREKWYQNDLSKVHKTIPMPVPSSYNDITEDNNLRDHVGTVWYDRKFFVATSWAQNKRAWIRFGSVHYEAYVYINGIMVVKHEIGHLPFEADITEYLKYGEENRVTVLCDNALLANTIPQGKITEMSSDNNETSIVQTYTFDFFNYAGIHRSVVLYTTPKVHIDDIITTTNIVDHRGRIFYHILTNKTVPTDLSLFVTIQIRDREGEIVATSRSPENDLKGYIEIKNVKPWWPYLMHSEPGYLYTMEVFLSSNTHENIDVYRLKIGVRSLQWNSKEFLINGKPIYFKGFGRHEDSDIRGKGLDMALLTKDFNLIKWIGANAYRTSHYPYSEESMQFADEHGIMIIDECPSVDTDNYTPQLLEKHKASIEQLIHRDKNHACVVMWSIANEPRTSKHQADSYFEAIANFTKSLDPNRPITAAIATPANDDKAAQFLDIISFNRYNGWYSNPGRLEMITSRVVDEAILWNAKHQKPVLMSEYGADTVEGLHFLPAFVWSEEYQRELYSRHFKAFDILRRYGWFIGEFIWNFADFKTNQAYTRVGGNKKGIFTRNRQPKEAAHHVRRRYFSLANQLDQCKLPDDLFPYLVDENQKIDNRIEL